MRFNLLAEMARNRVSVSALAELLSVHRNSIANKISGKTDFTLEQAFTIIDTFFPGADVRELFAVTKDND